MLDLAYITASDALAGFAATFAVLGGTSNVVDPAGKQTALPVLLKIRRQ